MTQSNNPTQACSFVSKESIEMAVDPHVEQRPFGDPRALEAIVIEPLGHLHIIVFTLYKPTSFQNQIHCLTRRVSKPRLQPNCQHDYNPTVSTTTTQLSARLQPTVSMTTTNCQRAVCSISIENDPDIHRLAAVLCCVVAAVYL